MKDRITALIIGAVFAHRSLAGPQGQPSSYTGAICIVQENPSAAVPAQCPADHPVSCSAISEANYCCAANYYCTWANSAVACCPNGETCSGWSPPPTTTWWQPSPTTYYAPPPTTVVTAPVVVVPPQQYTTTQYVTPYTKPNEVYAGYCSTLYETGPHLPTTAQGDCGTILITTPNGASRDQPGLLAMSMILVSMYALGGFVLAMR